jgi:hypothetical protein
LRTAASGHCFAKWGGLDLGVFAATLLLPQTGHQRFLVDVDPAAAGMQHLHRAPLFSETRRGVPQSESLPGVLRGP